MPIIKLPQNAFTSGVMNENRLRGRYDIKQYLNGAKRLENVNIHPQGGVYRRPGSLYLNDYTGEDIARLIRFDYSDSVQYLNVFRVGEIDVWEDDALAHTITTTGLTEDQIREMDFVQSANSMIIVHEDFMPKELVRGGSVTSWTLAAITFDPIPLFGFSLSSSNPTGTVTPSAISSTVTMTASASVFSASDVGGYVTGNGGEARITSYISGTVVEAKVTVPFIDTTAIPNGQWELETGYEDAWSVSREYPRSVAYHQDALMFGGSPSLPDVLWKSAIADYFNFDDTRGFNNDSVTTNVRSERINDIRAIVSGDDLMIFTSESEFYVDGKITPELEFEIKRQDKRGIRANVQPVFVDGAPIYADSKADVLREFVFSEADAKYNSTNLNILSTGIINSVVDIAHHEPSGDRDSDYVYAVNADGSWVVLNTLRKQSITGFTTGQSTNGDLKYLEDLNGVMYGIFERVIDSVTVLYFEKFDDDLTMDCVHEYSGVAIDTMTGLGKLEGETVGVLAGGAVLEDETVTSSQIVLDAEYTDIKVGIKYAPLIETLPPSRELSDGTMMGQIRRVVAVTVGMTDTFDLTVSGNEVKFRQFGDDLFGNPPPTFNGRKRVTLTGGYGRDPTIILTQEDPLPWHITDLVLEVKVS